MEYLLRFVRFIVLSFWLIIIIALGVSAGIKSACKDIVVMRGKKDAGEKQVEQKDL
jgi:hypothetical protein